MLVLASGSRYRRELLARLRLPFTSHAPGIDETPGADEAPDTLARRLARQKAEATAQALAPLEAPTIVIGSDQVAACGASLLGKPGTREVARRQLAACAGREMVYHTAVCVLRTGGDAAPAQHEHLDRTVLRLRPLTPAEIDRYLALEDALDCAGALKSEGLGVALLEHFESHDVTALVGLPLIWLAGTLRRLGLPPLGEGG